MDWRWCSRIMVRDTTIAHSHIPFWRVGEKRCRSGQTQRASGPDGPNGQSTIECLMRTNHYSRPIGIATWNTGNCPIKSLYASLLVSCKRSLSAFLFTAHRDDCNFSGAVGVFLRIRPKRVFSREAEIAICRKCDSSYSTMLFVTYTRIVVTNTDIGA